MGLFSDVKCGRCDRRYSGLRTRCPYCGARRGKRGKHARDNDNSTGRLVIGLILVVVLIVAVIAVVATSVTNNPDTGDSQLSGQGGNIADSDGVTNIEGVGAEDGTDTGDVGSTEGDGEADIGEATGTEGDDEGEDNVPEVSTAVNTLYITNPWSDDPQGDFTASVGDTIQFSYVAEPNFEDAEVLWATSDDNVFVVLQTGEFTAVGEGTAKMTLTVNDKTIELNVVVYD